MLSYLGLDRGLGFASGDLNRIHIKSLTSGSRAQDTGDSKNHALKDPDVVVASSHLVDPGSWGG